jgi:hypothetical protein
MKKCIVCGGSGWMPVRGTSRFDGLEVSGVKKCLCKDLGEPIVEEQNACRTCGRHGVYGGELYGQYAGPWKFCGCAAGQERQQREPGIVAASNIPREKLIRKFGKKPLQAMVAQLADADAYHGDF